jgi:transmembrane sensor
MTPEVFKDLLDKYLRGECSEDEKRLVEDWYDGIPVNKISIDDEIETKIWSNISSKSGLSTPSKKFLYLKIAASLLLLLSIAIVLYVQRKPVETARLQSLAKEDPAVEELNDYTYNDSKDARKIKLEDGSVITLQPKSRLSYPKHFTSKERVVSLNGEAFFDIRRDESRPFYVYSKEVVTKVLGTSFNIKARDTDKEIIVSVKTGKVSVYTNPKGNATQQASSVVLVPNQKAVYKRDEIVVTKELVDKPEIVLESPTLFKMQYDGANIAEIFTVIEENYGVEIEYDREKFKDCVLTTKMTDEGLFERISIICKAINAHYSVDNAVIKIEGSGCN